MTDQVRKVLAQYVSPEQLERAYLDIADALPSTGPLTIGADVDDRPETITATYLRKKRNQQWKAARRIVRNRRFKYILVRCGVKVGKRQIVEAVHFQDYQATHFFVTKLDHNDIKPQIEELEALGIICIVVHTLHDVAGLMDQIDEIADRWIYLHIDEADYGSGDKQLLSRLYYPLSSREGLTMVLYTATPAEIDHSDLDPYTIEFEPADTYRGPRWFWDNGLIVKVDSGIWDTTLNKLTQVGETAISRWKTSASKFIAIYRANGQYSAILHYQPFIDALREHGVRVQFVDYKRRFEWAYGSTDYRAARDQWEHDKRRTLIVVNQTFSRSTELGFHHSVHFMFDGNRSMNTPQNTIAQAQFRVVHYDTIGHPILVYTCAPEVWEKFAYAERNVIDLRKPAQRITSALMGQGRRHIVTVHDASELTSLLSKVTPTEKNNGVGHPVRWTKSQRERGHWCDIVTALGQMKLAGACGSFKVTTKPGGGALYYLDKPLPNSESLAYTHWKELESKFPEYVGKILWYCGVDEGDMQTGWKTTQRSMHRVTADSLRNKRAG